MKFIARVYVAGVLLAAALLSLAYSVPSLSTWWVELLQYLPYPAYLLPALLALLLSLLLSRLWRLLALLAVALVMTVIMGLVLGRGDAGSEPLRMMSYNVKAYLAEGRPGGWERLASEVAAHNPDLLVMQDAGELAVAHVRKPKIAAAIFAGRQVYFYQQYIIVSRFPLRECQPGDMPYRNERANYVHCVVAAPGGDIDLFTAHLVSPRRGLNATRYEAVDGIGDWQQNFHDRLTQSHELAQALVGHTRPVILAGDLNAPEASPVIRTLLAQGLRDAFSSAGRGYGYTLGHALRLGISFLRIDHILVSPEIGVVDSYPGGWQASEHRPVIADLVLRRSP